VEQTVAFGKRYLAGGNLEEEMEREITAYLK
jgi:hypothetical protein